MTPERSECLRRPRQSEDVAPVGELSADTVVTRCLSGVLTRVADVYRGRRLRAENTDLRLTHVARGNEKIGRFRRGVMAPDEPVCGIPSTNGVSG